MVFLNDMWIGVVQTIIITIMIYKRIGEAVFVGIGFFILVIPVQGKHLLNLILLSDSNFRPF